MTKNQTNTADKKELKGIREGWSQDWTKYDLDDLFEIATDSYETLTPEDRMYLLYANSECMTCFYNEYHDDITGGAHLVFKELSDPLLLKKFIEHWLEFEERNENACEDIAILFSRMISFGHLSPNLVQNTISREMIDRLTGLELNDDDFFCEEYTERFLDCYENIQLSDFDRLLNRDEIDREGKEFLFKRRIELENALLKNRADLIMEKPEAKFDAL